MKFNEQCTMECHLIEFILEKLFDFKDGLRWNLLSYKVRVGQICGLELDMKIL